MIRTVFAIITIILGLGVAVAAEDVIKQRKKLMKANGDQAKIGADMVKGEKPFNLEAAHKIFAAFQDAAAKMPNLFPDNSKPSAIAPTSSTPVQRSGKTWPTLKNGSPSLGRMRRLPMQA